jgi:membrane protein required for colicin V production
MNGFDFMILIALAITFMIGFRKGFVMQLVSFVGIMITLVFAGHLAKIIFPWVVVHLHGISLNFASVISYILAFSVLMALIFMIGKAIEKFIEIVHLSIVNKMAGAIISLGICMAILSLLLNLILTVDSNEKIISAQTKEHSFFFPRVQAVVPAVVPYLKKDVWMQYIPKENSPQPNNIKSKNNKIQL